LGVATRLPPMLERALLFAHRSERAADREQTLDGLDHALRRGATGIHVDVWATRDGEPVLSSDGLVRRFPRRRLGSFDAADLPEQFVTLDAVYERVGAGPGLSVSVADAESGSAVLRVARDHRAEATLWLNHHDPDVLARWRDESPEIKLVNVATLEGFPVGPERRAAELAATRIDAVSLPEGNWTGGMTTLFHRFDVLAFASGAHYERQIARVIDMGMDAIVGDQVERMAAVAATFD
jgi:glycerophosphoryl diester phosphodiesterase